MLSSTRMISSFSLHASSHNSHYCSPLFMIIICVVVVMMIGYCLIDLWSFFLPSYFMGCIVSDSRMTDDLKSTGTARALVGMWIEHLPNTSLDTTATPAHQVVIVSSCCLVLMVISSCAVIIAVYSSNKDQLLLMLDSSQLYCNSLFQAWVKHMRYCLLSVGHQLWWMTWVVVATVKERAVELQIASWMRSDTKVSSFPDDGWPLLTWLCPVINVSHLYTRLFPPHHKHSRCISMLPRTCPSLPAPASRVWSLQLHSVCFVPNRWQGCSQLQFRCGWRQDHTDSFRDVWTRRCCSE